MTQKTIIARKLRNNLTEAEKYLWYMLRLNHLGVKFRRQTPIGKYIVDFACLEKSLIIELDGGQHYDNKEDKQRDVWLEKEGFRVLRFWNNEILKNRDEVVGKILTYLK